MKPMPAFLEKKRGKVQSVEGKHGSYKLGCKGTEVRKSEYNNGTRCLIWKIQNTGFVDSAIIIMCK